uniref:Uncharacterized protein n=1 Tax=Arundo donax TaxID=35708 RepID=A0A0A8Y6B6_ARUDO
MFQQSSSLQMFCSIPSDPVFASSTATTTRLRRGVSGRLIKTESPATIPLCS